MCNLSLLDFIKEFVTRAIPTSSLFFKIYGYCPCFTGHSIPTQAQLKSTVSGKLGSLGPLKEMGSFFAEYDN